MECKNNDIKANGCRVGPPLICFIFIFIYFLYIIPEIWCTSWQGTGELKKKKKKKKKKDVRIMIWVEPGDEASCAHRNYSARERISSHVRTYMCARTVRGMPSVFK